MILAYPAYLETVLLNGVPNGDRIPEAPTTLVIKPVLPRPVPVVVELVPVHRGTVAKQDDGMGSSRGTHLTVDVKLDLGVLSGRADPEGDQGEEAIGAAALGDCDTRVFVVDLGGLDAGLAVDIHGLFSFAVDRVLGGHVDVENVGAMIVRYG